MDRKATTGGKEMRLRQSSIFNLQSSILFVLLALASIRGFLSIFAPTPYTPPVEAFTDYDRTGMLAAVTPARVRERLDAVAGLGQTSSGLLNGFLAPSAHKK